MGTCTKGVAVTPLKDVFVATSLISRGLDKLVRHGKRLEFPDLPAYSRTARAMYSSSDWRLLPDSQSAQVTLTMRGFVRMLTVNFSCDTDNLNLGKSSISLSLGDHGASELLMKAALYPLSLVGGVYFLASDSSGELEPLALPAMDVPTALSRGLVSAYQVEKWATNPDRARGLHFLEGNFEDVFGFSNEWFQQNQENRDPGARWDEMKLKMQRDTPLPEFWPQEVSDFGEAAATVLAVLSNDTND